MFDDECLPKAHPLRKYLSELELIDPDLESSTKPVISSFLNKCAPLIQWGKFISLLNFSSYVNPYVFCFAEHCRLRLLRTLLTSLPHADDEYAIHRQFFSSHAAECTWKRVLWVSFVYVASFIGLKICAFGVLWTLSCICFVTGFISMCVALCIFSVDCITRYLARVLSETRLYRRSCAMFIQEFEFHSTFGSSGSEMRAPLRLQRSFTECLRICVSELLDLCSAFTSFPIAEEFEKGLSSIQLDSLKESLASDSVNEVLSPSVRKMLREVVIMLESDLFDKITGVLFSLQVSCLNRWFKVAWLLCQCLFVARSLEVRFRRLNRLRIALEHGIAGSSESEAAATGLARPHFSHDSHTKCSPARNLLMHLLVAVSDVRELSAIFEQSNESSKLDALVVIKRIRLQLVACGTFCDVLEHFLSPDLVSSRDIPLLEKTNADASMSPPPLSNQPLERMPLEPIDPEPEDDVLEDIAVGGDAEDFVDETAYVDMDLGAHTSVPLHSSVLRELRLAISCRRVEMQEREQRALERRMWASLTGISGLASSQQVLETPVLPEAIASSGFRTLNHMGSSDLSAAPPSADDRGVGLCGFFSSVVTEPHPKLVALQQTIRSQCPWQAQSAVRKRMRRFPRFVPTRRCISTVVNTDDLNLTHPPPGLASGRPALDPSLAAALLSQRHKLGYAEEELFVEIGEGEDEPEPEQIVRRRNADSSIDISCV